VQEGANGDLTLVLRGSPPLAGRLLEFALLAEDTGRICLSGFSVLPDADGNLTSTVHVSREALAARLGHTAVRAVAYPLELADLSIHDVMTLCWSVTMADKATQPAWGALCRRWQKLVPAGSLLHAWAEEVARALGQDQQDTKATAPATPEPKRRQHPPQLRLIGRGTEHRGGAQHRRASRPVGRRFQGKPPREQEVGELLYAAEMTQAALPEERLREPLARIPLGTFEFAGVRYEVLADAQGQVLLSPAPEPGKTHLVLEGVSYLLERLEGEEALCRVIGVERGQLGLFFARRRTEQAQHYIGFE